MIIPKKFLLKTRIDIVWRCNSNLSYIHKPGKKPLRYITMGQLADETVEKYADNIVIISKHQNKQLTYHQMLEKADKLAASFKKIGLQKSDRVGLWAPNLAEWFIAKMACARAGLISVGLNPLYQAKEIEYCINKAKLKAIICADRLKEFDYYDNLLKVAPNLKKSSPGNVKSPNVSSLSHVIALNKAQKPGTYSYEDLLNLATPSEVADIKDFQNRINPDEILSLDFTTGTTGSPKVVPLTHFSVVNNAYYYGKNADMHLSRHIICMQVPFFHIFGGIAGFTVPLTFANTIVLPSESFSSTKSLDAISEKKCNMVYGTPTMYIDLIEMQDKRKEKIFLDGAVIGGAVSTPHLLNEIKNKLNVKKILAAYGLTEVCGAAFLGNTKNKTDILDTVGCLQEHLEAKVIDKFGNVVPFGTPGELCIRGFSTMTKYWDDEEETRKIKVNRWLKTGDQFILEENGYGKIVGRLKEIINRGGENIFPKEIEELLLTHPDILEVYVIGTTHKRLGEEICACVRTHKDLTLESIQNFCKGNIASYKIPSLVEFFEEFPKTVSGKVQKLKLKEMVEQNKK